jgi:hypothetical protein
MALVMAPDVNTIQSLMRAVKVVWKCSVVRTMRKSLPRKQLLEQLLAAKRRKRQKKLRSEQWRFEMAMAG